MILDGGGHLEDGKVITCDQAPHPRVTNHLLVSAGKQEKMKVLGNTFNDGASISATFQFLDDR